MLYTNFDINKQGFTRRSTCALISFPSVYNCNWVVQSVKRLATGWTAKGSDFESRKGQEFSSLHVVQTDPGAHSNSYPFGTGAFSRELSGRGVKLITHLPLVQSSRIRGSIHPHLHITSCSS
jgi:hypothetical protein